MGTGLRLFRIGSPALGVTIEQQAELAKQAVDKTQPADLKLLISTGVPVGGASSMFGGSDHIVEATVVNTSDRPIGVQSIGLELEDGQWIPGLHASPSVDSKRLLVVLAPQEQAAVWWDHGALRDSLEETGRRSAR